MVYHICLKAQLFFYTCSLYFFSLQVKLQAKCGACNVCFGVRVCVKERALCVRKQSRIINYSSLYNCAKMYLTQGCHFTGHEIYVKQGYHFPRQSLKRFTSRVKLSDPIFFLLVLSLSSINLTFVFHVENIA